MDSVCDSTGATHLAPLPTSKVTSYPWGVASGLGREGKSVMLHIGKILLILISGHGLVSKAGMALHQALAVEAIRQSGGFVFYDWEFVDDKLTPGRQPPVPGWLQKALGDEFFQEVVEVNLVYGATPAGKRVDVEAISDDVIPQLLVFPHLKRLYIHKVQATDKAMETVKRLADLEVLMMWDAKVTDVGVAKLSGLKRPKNIHISNAGLGDESLKSLSLLPRLEIISAQGSRFTDKGLAYLKAMIQTDQGMIHLKGLAKLERLGLHKTKVTDQGLEHLKRLKNLTELWISDIQITQEAIDRLKSELPNLKDVQ